MKALPKIPDHEVLTCLGGGQLTLVYSARALADDSPCAVKVIRPDWQDHPTAIKLLQREARACLAVQHPHLVHLRHAHVTRAPYFLVFDMLTGESVRDRLRREYVLEVPLAVWIARQTAEALAALHRARFIHADVKPDNIRLVGEGHVILLDLGFTHRPGENSFFLEKGFVMGTVNYLPPELCSREPADGFASDMFSLGVMLFEMLTGQLPYPPGTTEQTMRRHESDAARDIRELAPALPSGLAELVNRLLSKSPRERPKALQVVQKLITLEIAALRWRKAA
jgi:eukaryotic-like serine/threonine-protein kinase